MSLSGEFFELHAKDKQKWLEKGYYSFHDLLEGAGEGQTMDALVDQGNTSRRKQVSTTSDHDIQRVQDALNSRPRKYFGFNTPNDIFKPPQPVALAS